MSSQPNTRRSLARGGNARRWFAGLAAVLAGAAAGSWTVTHLENSAEASARVGKLEHQVQQLQAGQEQQERSDILREAARAATRDAGRGPAFALRCPAPWQELGALGQGLWGCRPPEPLAGGFYPNCNLTRSQVRAGLTPQQYFASATAASAQLSAALQLGGRTLQVHERSAYEASFEHSLTGSPLRVLATVFVAGTQAYAITCSAPPSAFDALAARFRDIAGSFQLEP
jgi:hypothetical protein